MSAISIDRFASKAPSRRSTVRLTRRGKVVVFSLALLVLLSIALIGADIAGAAGQRGHLSRHAVTVQPGDTLWGLASRAAHGGDVRAMEREILDLNGLDTAVVYAGQELVVPS